MTEQTYTRNQVANFGKGRCARCKQPFRAIKVFVENDNWRWLLVTWDRERKLWVVHECPVPAPAAVAA